MRATNYMSNHMTVHLSLTEKHTEFKIKKLEMSYIINIGEMANIIRLREYSDGRDAPPNNWDRWD